MHEFRAITNASDSVEFGASVTLNEVADYLTQRTADSVTFKPIASHLLQIASKSIRNVSNCVVFYAFSFRCFSTTSFFCLNVFSGSANLEAATFFSFSMRKHFKDAVSTLKMQLQLSRKT